MKIKLLFTFLFFSLFSFSQQTEEDLNTIENQFDKIYRTSSSYQVYKVISKERYQQLKNNVLDSIKKLNSVIKNKETKIQTESKKNEGLHQQLNTTKEDLKNAINKENSISFFGLSLKKTTYNLLLWSIIIILILLLSLFIFKFYKSNVLTKKAKHDLEDNQIEFEEHRKKSLLREQKLRRQLQDEINKQRNS